jgi:Cu2+-exporting ATPase
MLATKNIDKNFRHPYFCPMHSEVRQAEPGLCPECGMNLIFKRVERDKYKLHACVKQAADYDRHSGHSTETFLKKFWVSLILAIPVILYSDITRHILRWSLPEFAGSKYLPLLFGSIVFFYGGWIFIVGAWRELKARLPGMMTLIGIAVSAAYFYSVYATFREPGHTLFWELTTLISVMLLGHWLEMKAVGGAQRALKELSKLLPDTAEVVDRGKIKIIPLSELQKDDVVFIRPGSKVPADGVVIDGKSEVNESIITGESTPVPKVAGSKVIAGSVNGDGSLKVKVTEIGEKTFLAGITRLVREAQASKSRLQILSDRAAFYLTLVAITTSFITIIAWLVLKAGLDFAVERTVAVLVIACPHALGLAVPLIASISTALAARHGFLVKQRLALETARNISIVLFDKTGTLTEGKYKVVNVWLVGAKDEKELLQFTASVDFHSEHFISKAIMSKAGELGVDLLNVTGFERLPGKGVKGVVNGATVYIGGYTLLKDLNIAISSDLLEDIDEENKKGRSIVYVIKNEKLFGVLSLADVIREESRQAVDELKRMGIKIAMITGDSPGVAQWVAGELGIDEYFARVLPQEKSEKVKLLQSKGEKVAMVGDGVNDAPALAQADLGIAIGAGTNIAIESAGIILVRNDPRDIVKIIRLSRLTYRKMVQNLFWATGYNIVALPLAAGVLATKGIFLQPALAALFMSLSTIIVAINAMSLKKIVL